jgi:hypothetical protein
MQELEVKEEVVIEGEKGERVSRRTGKSAAAATGPGDGATDQTADSVSLAVSTSSPNDNGKDDSACHMDVKPTPALKTPEEPKDEAPQSMSLEGEQADWTSSEHAVPDPRPEAGDEGCQPGRPRKPPDDQRQQQQQRQQQRPQLWQQQHTAAMAAPAPTVAAQTAAAAQSGPEPIRYGTETLGECPRHTTLDTEASERKPDASQRFIGGIRKTAPRLTISGNRVNVARRRRRNSYSSHTHSFIGIHYRYLFVDTFLLLFYCFNYSLPFEGECWNIIGM